MAQWFQRSKSGPSGIRRAGTLRTLAGLYGREQAILDAVLEAAPVSMALVDQDQRVVRGNQAMARSFGLEPGTLPIGLALGCPEAASGCGQGGACRACELTAALGRALGEGVATEDQEAFLRRERSGAVTERWVVFSVRPLTLQDGNYALLSLTDITERKTHQQQLLDLAATDGLTGLPNRARFLDRLNLLVAGALRAGKCAPAGILFLSLDGFKSVNETLGHEAGDCLLRELGERLRGALRDYDTVSRLGGDAFAILLPELREDVDLGSVARKVLAAVAAPFAWAGRTVAVTASVGIACFPTDSQEPQELVRFADAAMHHAKDGGGNGFRCYSKAMMAKAADRMELALDLRQAQAMGELELYFQPKVDTLLGALVGAEALIRWHHPTRGMVPPDRFIGLAEDTGLIIPMGAWVLDQACRAASGWNRGAQYPVKIAVNLSVKQFLTGDLVATVRATLAATGCLPQWLELEITESLLLKSNPAILQALHALKDLGVSIALDDFGTGYSSLSYLTQFPFSVLKIDKSFIATVLTQKQQLELVKAIISMGHSLGLELVAEGVETSEQAARLDALGCHIIQGYFYGRPMPLAAFDAWCVTFHRSRLSGAAPEQTAWRDYLTTGDASIDAQHREIFRRINNLTLACRSGRGHTEVAEMLQFLAGYVVTHFAEEEQLLFASGSSQFVEHQAAHEGFKAVIGRLLNRFQAGDDTLALTVETNQVAVGWLTRHICTMDRQLAELLHRN